jgi:hypothetical protein
MRKHYCLLLISALLVPATFAHSAENPPGTAGEDVFAGHFGELIRLPFDWTAAAEMQGPTESIHIYRKRTKLIHTAQGTGYAPDVPSGSDFIPENLTSQGLIALIAAPKDAPGGYRNLDDLRRAKERELSARGMDFRIEDNCGFKQRFEFPAHSFQVWVNSPYRLYQCYTASPEAIFILSSADPRSTAPGSSEISRPLEMVQRSLERYLQAVVPPSVTVLDLRGFKGFWKGWLPLCGLFILLMALPGAGPFAKRANVVGRNLLILVNAFGLIGFLIPVVSYRSGLGAALWRNSGTISVIPAILGPWLIAWIADRFCDMDRKRAFRWSWVAAAPLIAVSLQDHFQPSAPVADIILGSTLMCALEGIAFGLVLSFQCPRGEGLGRATPAAGLLVIFLALSGSSARAQMIPDAVAARSTPEAVARMLRSQRPAVDYHKRAIEELKAADKYYDLESVEVTGFTSTDNTFEYDPNLFVKQIKPSFFVDPGGRGVIASMRSGWRWITGATLKDDTLNAMLDTQGHLTQRAKEVLADYQDVKINQLVAHSWGTELIYNAIASGYIKAPKTLIVVGVPDANREKWDKLSVMTGTVIHFCKSQDDLVAIWGGAIAKEDDATSKQTLANLWFEYENAHGGGGTGDNLSHVIVDYVESIPGLLGHDRLAYYEFLKKNKLIKTPSQLDREQAQAVEEKEEQLRGDDLSLEYNEAIGVIEKAKISQQRIAREQRAIVEGEIAAVKQAEAVAQEKAQQFAWALKLTAVKACNSPESITERDASDLSQTYAAVGGYSDFSYADSVGAGISGCAKNFYDRILGLAKSHRLRLDGTSAQYLHDLGRFFNPPPPAPEPAPSTNPAPAPYVPLLPEPRERPDRRPSRPADPCRDNGNIRCP